MGWVGDSRAVSRRDDNQEKGGLGVWVVLVVDVGGWLVVGWLVLIGVGWCWMVLVVGDW